MASPFVKSNFERIKNDDYKTIDKRCIYAFLEHFNPSGLCIDPCSPSGSGIIDTLKEEGYSCFGVDSAYASFNAQWVITNPPYRRDLVDHIVREQIRRVECKEVDGCAILLRAYFDYAKTRSDMFDSPYYAGQIKMRFRPWWSEDRSKTPIHHYVWQIWHILALEQKHPFVLYSKGSL